MKKEKCKIFHFELTSLDSRSTKCKYRLAFIWLIWTYWRLLIYILSFDAWFAKGQVQYRLFQKRVTFNFIDYVLRFKVFINFCWRIVKGEYFFFWKIFSANYYLSVHSFMVNFFKKLLQTKKWMHSNLFEKLILIQTISQLVMNRNKFLSSQNVRL